MRAARFENANVLTLDPHSPVANHLLVQGGLIQAEGSADSVVDLGGATVVPGFIDNHCHLLAMGTWEASVDCGPDVVDSISHLIAKLGSAASSTSTDWIFGVGYDDMLIEEARHPNAADLDRVITRQPILLTHSSGHAHVLNSKGLSELGITASSEEPSGGTIDRLAETGEPSGLLLEMGEYISSRLPRRAESERVEAIANSFRKLASAGVTSATDAGHRNDVARLAMLASVAASAGWAPRLRVMLSPGIERGRLEAAHVPLAGHTKVMLTQSAGVLSHGLEELRELAFAEHAIGAPGIAIHAVETEAVELAARLARTLAEDLPGFGVRIEHASEASGATVDAVKRSGATVVTQPGFIWSRGARYIATKTASDALYPLKSWQKSDVPVAYGSDAPYGPAAPLIAIQSAVTRRSMLGPWIGRSQAINVSDALRMVTRDSDGTQKTLMPGEPADFVVLSDDPNTIHPDQIGKIAVVGTYVAGRKIWPPED